MPCRSATNNGRHRAHGVTYVVGGTPDVSLFLHASRQLLNLGTLQPAEPLLQYEACGDLPVGVPPLLPPFEREYKDPEVHTEGMSAPDYLPGRLASFAFACSMAVRSASMSLALMLFRAGIVRPTDNEYAMFVALVLNAVIRNSPRV